ncbi:hypothetical protein [Mobilicoccus sp.]|uniref:hypothetical protein n=1 Tax=Mobilicoccus sp. TaxID=2034349 RepID=UPI0028A7979D|nr:hypothetical protein [Mobilicoccus sp.]
MTDTPTRAFLVSFVCFVIVATGLILTTPRLFDPESSASWWWALAVATTVLGLATMRLRPRAVGTADPTLP